MIEIVKQGAFINRFNTVNTDGKNYADYEDDSEDVVLTE